MSTSAPQATPQPSTPLAAMLPSPDRQDRSRRTSPSLLRVLGLVVAISLAALSLPVFILCWQGRVSHSLTDDAFVEAHTINLAPESVSGRIVRVFAVEGDRVQQSQVVLDHLLHDLDGLQRFEARNEGWVRDRVE